MSGSSYRYYDDGADYRDTNHRDRSLRALEGRSGSDWSRDIAPPDADDEVTESENNTADIFMRIAREDSSSSLPRPKPQGRGEEESSNTVVSPGNPFSLQDRKSSFFFIYPCRLECGS